MPFGKSRMSLDRQNRYHGTMTLNNEYGQFSKGKIYEVGKSIKS